MASPMAQHTPMHSPFFIADELMAPAETRSTCLLRTCTAGSAATTKYPMTIPTGMSSQPPQREASVRPISLPTGMKPTFAPVKKSTSPTKV